jgi:hypothetical protein
MSAEKRYLDCELHLTGFNQAVLRVGGSEYSGRPKLDASLQERLLQAELDDTQYGSLLFEALLPSNDDLSVGYREALSLAKHSDRRLRFRLFIDTNAPIELHSLSWELLYDTRDKNALSRGHDTIFSRYLGAGGAPRELVDVNTAKLLVVVSAPTNVSQYGLSVIDRELITAALKEVLISLQPHVKVEFLSGYATRTSIYQRLTQGAYDAVHIQAHGKILPSERVATLVLEKDNGEADFVREDIFGDLFQGQQQLQLVTLIACHGANVTRDDPFSGLGPVLIRMGAPAVVAMRNSISTGAAALFSRHFYGGVAQTGRVDVAANYARNQMRFAESKEWSSPILYMRSKEGEIWRARSTQACLEETTPDSTGLFTPLKSMFEQNRVVPFIGPGINSGLLVSPAEITEQWAKQHNYEKYNFPLNDRNDLPRVAQFVETIKDSSRYPHAELLQLLRADLLKREKVEERKVISNMTLHKVFERVTYRHFDTDSDEPHRVLAELPFSLYVTTNFDSFMTAALAFAKREFETARCDWAGALEDGSKERRRYDSLRGSREKPLVFYLYGHNEDSSSLVLTEDDHLDFLRFISQEKQRIPSNVWSMLNVSTLLFLGYNIRDLDFRILFKGVAEEAKRMKQSRIAIIQIDPTDTTSQEELARLQTFATRDLNNLQIRPYFGSVRKFMTELRAKL